MPPLSVPVHSVPLAPENVTFPVGTAALADETVADSVAFWPGSGAFGLAVRAVVEEYFLTVSLFVPDEVLCALSPE